MTATTPGARVLILSAPVGAGHDAAAAALAGELRGRGAVVEVMDGLALLGVERLVVSGYRFQILHAPWSWRVVYRLTRSRLLIRLAGALLAKLGSRRLAERVAESAPDVIVSVYPIVSIALAGLRRRALLPHPTATLVTDFDPHPGWIHPELDANLVVGSPGRAGTPVSPPTQRPDLAVDVRRRLRAELSIDEAARVVLIVGGAWGVGNLRGGAHAAITVPGVHVIVVTGHNAHLLASLRRDPVLQTATLMGFTTRMPELMAASDVMMQNAGGLTCLEAFAAGLPVLMFDPLPGHGEDNSRLMAGAGLVMSASTAQEVGRLLGSAAFWENDVPAVAARAAMVFERGTAGAAVVALVGAPVRQPGRIRRLAPVAAASVVLGAWLVGENAAEAFDLTDHPAAAQVRPAGTDAVPVRSIEAAPRH